MADNKVEIKISADHREADNGIKVVKRNLEDIGTSAKSSSGPVQGLKSALSSVNGVLAVIGGAATFGGVIAGVKKALELIDDFNLSIIKSAALITSFQGTKDVWQNYQKAYTYSAMLADKLQEIDAKTFAGAKDLQAMTGEMIKQRVLLDVNNKAQVEGFIAIANAVKVMAQGGNSEMQIRQETRALMAGQVNEASALASMVDQIIKGEGEYKGGLKEAVKHWKDQGTILEEMGKRLIGFTAASKDIEGTWEAVKSSMETAVNKVMRDGFSGVFKDVLSLTEKLNKYLKENSAEISEGIGKGWLTVKGLVETVWNGLTGMSNVLKTGVDLLLGWVNTILQIIPGFENANIKLGTGKGLVGSILEGLGFVASVILPAMSEKFLAVNQALMGGVTLAATFGKLMFNAVRAVAESMISVGKGMFAAMTGDWQGMADSFSKVFTGTFAKAFQQDASGVKSAIAGIGNDMKKAVSTDGFWRRYDEFTAKRAVTAASSETPDLNSPGYNPEETLKNGRKQIRDMKSAMAELRRELDEAKKVGGLYEWYEQFEAIENLKKMPSDALRAPKITGNAPKTSLLDGIDTTFKSLEQLADEANAAKEAVSSLSDITSRLQDLQIDGMTDPYQKQMTIIQKRYKSERDEIKKTMSAWSSNSEIQQKGTEALHQLDRNEAEETTRTKMYLWSSSLSFYGGLMDQMSGIIDTSSRDGFEAAKAFSIGSAVMNTAGAVMNALATVQPYPAAIAAAAVAAATGAMQIAKIASTTYGGGTGDTSFSVPGFSGGSASMGGSVGGSIGVPTTSIHDQLTDDALQALAASAENASLALDKVTNGLTSIADLFESDQSKLLSGSLVSGGYSGLQGWLGRGWDEVKDGIGSLFTGDIANLIVSPIRALVTTLFGGDWATTAAGLRLSGTGSGINVRQYLKQERDGGWFGSDETRFQYSDVSQGLSDTMQGYLQQVESTISRAAAAMGATTDMGGVVLPIKKIQTSGVTSEKIQEKLQAWFEDVADQLAQTTGGLKEFTYYGESAFDAVIRLSSALQSANESLELIGANLIDSPLHGANAAYQLQELMGGSKDFTDKVKTYFESMFTEDEQKAMQAAQAQRQLTVAFNEMNAAVSGLGWTVPSTRQGFVGLVNGLDLTTDTGRALFAALMDVAPALDTVQTQLEETADAANELAKAQDELNDSLAVRALQLAGKDSMAELLNKVLSAESEILSAREQGLDVTKLQKIAYAELTKYLGDEYTTAADNYTSALESLNSFLVESARTVLSEWQSSAKTYEDIAASLKQTRQSLMIGDLASGSMEDRLREAKSQLWQYYGAGMSGDTDALKAMSNAANSYLSLARQYYASSPAYAVEYDTVLGMLSAAESKSTAQVDYAQRQVELQQQIIDKLQKSDEERKKEQEAQLREQVAQTQALLEGFRQLIALANSSGGSLENIESLLEREAAA